MKISHLIGHERRFGTRFSLKDSGMETITIIQCLPILKTRQDREALIEAAIGGCPRFFLGTDSAPHKKRAKQSACGCAGIYSANAALSYYAEVFDAQGALGRLENFASVFGAEFYGLPLNESSIELERREWCVEPSIAFDDDEVVPLLAGQRLQWKKVS